MKSRPIFIFPLGLIFVLSFFNMCTPGGMVSIYLAGAATCFLPIIFSARWPKYVGIIFCFIFIFLAGLDLKQGIEYNRKMKNLKPLGRITIGAHWLLTTLEKRNFEDNPSCI